MENEKVRSIPHSVIAPLAVSCKFLKLFLSSNQQVLSLVSPTWELCVFLFLFFEISAEFVVTASRGVACVFAARKRALVYILEEDEDEVSDAE